MKDIFKQSLQSITNDRWLMGLMIANLVTAIVIVIILLITIEPSEAQVITRYTSYGVTNFYRGHWYTLLNYLILAVLMMFGHTVLSLKLVQINRRDLALALLWLTLGLMVLLLIFASSIIEIAALV